MRIAFSSNGKDSASETSPVFGRCPVYMFVDSETFEFEAVDNPAMSASGGAGIQAAQFIVAQGAQAVVSGHMGPNAYQVLAAANIPIFLSTGGSMRDAVEALKSGSLQPTGGATVGAHSGMGMSSGRGMGQSRGGMRQQPAPQIQPAQRDQDIAELRRAAADLRKQLADIMDKIDNLDKGE